MICVPDGSTSCDALSIFEQSKKKTISNEKKMIDGYSGNTPFLLKSDHHDSTVASCPSTEVARRWTNSEVESPEYRTSSF